MNDVVCYRRCSSISQRMEIYQTLWPAVETSWPETVTHMLSWKLSWVKMHPKFSHSTRSLFSKHLYSTALQCSSRLSSSLPSCLPALTDGPNTKMWLTGSIAKTQRSKLQAELWHERNVKRRWHSGCGSTTWGQFWLCASATYCWFVSFFWPRR